MTRGLKCPNCPCEVVLTELGNERVRKEGPPRCSKCDVRMCETWIMSVARAVGNAAWMTVPRNPEETPRA